MDAQVGRLLARVAAEDSGTDFNAYDWERLYHVAAFTCTENVVPTQEEVKTHLMMCGSSLQKASIVSQQFEHLCGILTSRDRRGG